MSYAVIGVPREVMLLLLRIYSKISTIVSLHLGFEIAEAQSYCICGGLAEDRRKGSQCHVLLGLLKVIAQRAADLSLTPTTAETEVEANL